MRWGQVTPHLYWPLLTSSWNYTPTQCTHADNNKVWPLTSQRGLGINACADDLIHYSKPSELLNQKCPFVLVYFAAAGWLNCRISSLKLMELQLIVDFLFEVEVPLFLFSKILFTSCGFRFRCRCVLAKSRFPAENACNGSRRLGILETLIYQMVPDRMRRDLEIKVEKRIKFTCNEL